MVDEQETDRRKVLKSGIALGGLAATAGMPFWSKLALAQGEELVPFTDVPEDYAVAPKAPGAIHFVTRATSTPSIRRMTTSTSYSITASRRSTSPVTSCA